MTEQEHGTQARQEQGIQIEQSRKRVRVYLSGDLVADTTRPFLVWEWPYYPVYYIPAEDVRAQLIPAGQAAGPADLGDAELMHVSTLTAVAEGAGRRYPGSPVPQLRDLVRLEFSAMTEWFEED